jgi:excinuclease ABC subunit C
LAKSFASFIASSDNSLIREFRERMADASEGQNYEAAAGYRDQIHALEAVRAKSAVVFSDNTSADFVSVAMDGYSAAANLFVVRDGRIRGVKSWVVDLELDRSEAELIAYTLENIYLVEAFDSPPGSIYVENEPEMRESLESLLGDRRQGRVSIKVAKRGEKLNLLETARKNAQHALDAYKLKRSTDFTSRSVALSNLQEALGLETPPINIECFDVSHLAGTGIVASKVVFIDGRPKKDLYRRYTLESATDDTDAMNQVLARRFKAMASEELPPSLIVVDGAKPQVNAAVKAAHNAGLGNIAIVGIAKRLEELWSANDDFPVILPRSSAELFLIQHLRDEAHRFAIAHQRLKRTASLTTKLDEIPGLGPKKIAILLRHFGSIKRVAAASEAEITDLPGFSATLASQILGSLAK